MKVLKFGGTSVGSAQRMKAVAELLQNDEQKMVVLSAMSGTTNSLLQIADYIRLGNVTSATELVNSLELKYNQDIEALYSTDKMLNEAKQAIGDYLRLIRSLCMQGYSEQLEKTIVSFGEQMSTKMFALYLTETGVDAVLLPALDFMRLQTNGEPDLNMITSLLKQVIAEAGEHLIYITQGFICLDSEGKITNLQRGGSDYTASLVGAAIDAEEIQIWTDIDGMHNNDPRFVDNTSPVPQLSFEEAAELAYFGAKILHPTCILPAKMKSIPVRLLNTMQPNAAGTLISNDYKKGKIEAIAAKDGIAAVRIQSDRMLLAYGFLSRVFEVFEKYKTSIDLITTSEVAVSMSIDNLSHIGSIVEELRKLGTVSFETGLTIISVVGDLRSDNLGFEANVIEAIKDLPVRMISYGGSDHNISLLVRTDDKTRALRQLSKKLF